MRFSELRRAIPLVTQKMLCQRLRELEYDGTIERHRDPNAPRKTAYGLTPWGKELAPALAALGNWAKLTKSEHNGRVGE